MHAACRALLFDAGALALSDEDVLQLQTIAWVTDDVRDKSTTEIIRFDRSNYPVIRRLRDEAGLPASEDGVVVRYILGAKDAPSFLRDDFSGTGIYRNPGMIYGPRYLVIDRTESRHRSIMRSLLVGTYLCAAYGGEALCELPEWFTAGTCLYYADYRPRVIAAESFRQVWPFKQLAKKIGREEMGRFVLEGFETGDPEAAFRKAAGESYKTFAQRELHAAEEWDQEKIAIRRYSVWGLLIALGALLVMQWKNKRTTARLEVQ